MTEVIVLQQALPAAVQILGAGKTPTGQQAPVHDTKKQRSWVKPRAVFGRAMHDMAVACIPQEGPALPPLFALLRCKGPLAPPSQQAAHVQTPVGVQVVHDPVITFPGWQAVSRRLEMRHNISGRPGAPQGPSAAARRHGQGIAQPPRTMAAGRMFTPCAPARWGRLGGCCPLAHVHAGLLIAAKAQAPLCIGRERLGVQRAKRVRCGLQGLIVAVPPGRTRGRLQSNVVQDTPAACTADGLGVQSVKRRGHELIPGPAGNGVLLGWWQLAQQFPLLA